MVPKLIALSAAGCLAIAGLVAFVDAPDASGVDPAPRASATSGDDDWAASTCEAPEPACDPTGTTVIKNSNVCQVHIEDAHVEDSPVCVLAQGDGTDGVDQSAECRDCVGPDSEVEETDRDTGDSSGETAPTVVNVYVNNSNDNDVSNDNANVNQNENNNDNNVTSNSSSYAGNHYEGEDSGSHGDDPNDGHNSHNNTSGDGHNSHNSHNSTRTGDNREPTCENNGDPLVSVTVCTVNVPDVDTGAVPEAVREVRLTVESTTDQVFDEV